jgi:hypothetical protein
MAIGHPEKTGKGSSLSVLRLISASGASHAWFRSRYRESLGVNPRRLESKMIDQPNRLNVGHYLVQQKLGEIFFSGVVDE